MDYPQIVTTITQGLAPISSIVDAPWVSVTSLNGMTGDVIVEPVIKPFQSNHYYLEDSVITYGGAIYFAKQTFTSGESFNPNDWDMPDFAQEQADWNENDSTAKSYIKNKPTIPTKTSEITNDSDFITSSDLPTVNDATLTIQKNATTIDSFTANSATNKTVNIIVPTDTGDLTNNAGYLKATDIYPVGSVRIFADNLDHSADYGMTWVRYAQGRTLVGVDSEDTDFDNVGDTGGEKKHTLTVDEMPKHKHTLLCGYGEGSAGRDAFRYQYWASGNQGYQDWLVGESGSNTAHNNLQPYIVVSFWRRTA